MAQDRRPTLRIHRQRMRRLSSTCRLRFNLSLTDSSALPAPYVIDHMGTVLAAKGIDDPGFTSLLDLQRRDPKCWVKITGLERASAVGKPFHDALPFARALIDNAPDRVIWGTDWPHPNVKIMPNDGEIVDLIPLYAPDPAKRHKLLVANPEKLFGFAKM